MAILCTIFACFGFLNEQRRGALVSVAIVFYMANGCFAGYCSARIYKMLQVMPFVFKFLYLKGSYWIRCAILTGFIYPGINFIILVVNNIMLKFE